MKYEDAMRVIAKEVVARATTKAKTSDGVVEALDGVCDTVRNELGNAVLKEMVDYVCS